MHSAKFYFQQMKTDLKIKLQQTIDHLGDNEPILIAEIQKLLADEQLVTAEQKLSQPFAALMHTEIQKQINSTGKLNFIATGFPDFDQEYGGFAFGEYIILGSRPGMGNTQLLINLSLHISKQMPLVFFTNRMSEVYLSKRFLSTIQNLELKKVIQQDLDNDEKESLNSLELKEYKLHINNAQAYNMALFLSECLRLVQEEGVKVIVLDNIQHLSNTNYRKEKEFELNLISRKIKQFATEHQVCFIASSQLSRAVESRHGTKVPQLFDLRESGALEEDADKVFFLYRPEYYGIDGNEEIIPGERHWHLAKNQSGHTGTIKLCMSELKNNLTELAPVIPQPFGFSSNQRFGEFY